MGTSEDRWTCPDCNRTFVVGDPFGEARARLAVVQEQHAEEHAGRDRSWRGSRPSIDRGGAVPLNLRR